MCGPSGAAIAAREWAVCEEQIGLLRHRPPLRPIPMAELASYLDDCGVKEEGRIPGMLNFRHNTKA